MRSSDVVDAARTAGELPDFDAPPVVEIVGAVQFNALPRLELRDMIAVGSRLAGYELSELHPQLPPIQELPPGVPAPPPFPQMFFGQQPQRAIYAGKDQRFTAQLQRDRIAINERRTTRGLDPSSVHVLPELEGLADVVQELLVNGEGFGPLNANVVELTYVNEIREAPIDRVFRIVSGDSGDSPYTNPEGVGIRFAFPALQAGRFRGRLHVAAGPGLVDGSAVLQIQLISRRLVEKDSTLEEVFDACHRDAVNAFAAVTEPEMHTIWRRTR